MGACWIVYGLESSYQRRDHSPPPFALDTYAGRSHRSLFTSCQLIPLSENRSFNALTSCRDLDDHIIRMLDLRNGYFADADLEWSLIVDGFHGGCRRYDDISILTDCRNIRKRGRKLDEGFSIMREN